MIRRAALRWRLLLLAAVAILPLALMAGIALQALVATQRLQNDQSSLDLTRALATAVDNELRLTSSALQALAAAEPIAGAGAVDVESFSRLGDRVLAARPEWRALLLTTPDGRTLFNSPVRSSAPLPPLTDPESFASVLRTRAPAIGSLARGLLGNVGVPVRIPILADGEVRFVLTAIVRPEAILSLITRQRVPPDWTVSVLDRHNILVARSRNHERYLGSSASPSLVALLHGSAGTEEAVGTLQTLEGERVRAALTRLGSSGWTVALGVPTAVTDTALRDFLLIYGGGILLSLGIGALAAWFVARSIARPMARLRDAARAFGHGQTVTAEPTAIGEIAAVSEALRAASAERIESEAERERLFDAERAARTAAERARRHLELLAGAGSTLSGSLEEATTLEAIAHVLVPDIGDVCRIDLLDKDGVLQRKLTHHRDPERGRRIAEHVGKGQVSSDAPGSFPWVIAQRQTYLRNVDRPEDFGISDPTFAEFARLSGMRAACVVPLIARGRVIGALGALQAESGRHFSAEDGVLIGELAQLAALALDNVRLYAESKAALQEAEVANRVKDEFLAMLGHELRNPLAPIVTSLELMARREPALDASERRVIERQVAHLARLVDDLLDVSRITTGKIHLRAECIDLRSVIGRALELIEPGARQRSRPITVALPDAPVLVCADPLRLAQVIGNLLANAVKFSAPHGDIRIGLDRVDGCARVVVEDDGIGIDAELLPRIFERFVQGGAGRQVSRGGLGLGLAIARSLVELHTGALRADSAGEGRGSRFTLTLPLASAAATESAPPAPPVQPRRAARLLIVDDNDDAAQSLAHLLRFEGHEVRTAASAEDALLVLAADIPDVAILDIGLPGKSGHELARIIRADPHLAAIHLIALTGYGRAPDRQRALDAGFDEHLVKPVDIESLLSRLDALLAGRSDARGTPVASPEPLKPRA